MRGLSKVFTILAAFFAVGLQKSASATVYNVALSGVTGNFSVYSANGLGPASSLHFEGVTEILDGLGSGNDIDLLQGDVINFSITFDQSYTLPSSVNYSTFGIRFISDNLDLIYSINYSQIGIFNNSDLIKSGSSIGVCVYCVGASAAFMPPDNGAITFDSLSGSLSIAMLSAPITVNAVEFSALRVSPAIPEPTSWALMINGLALMGGALRYSARAKARTFATVSATRCAR